MTLRDFLPPVLSARFDAMAKSWAAASLAWRRGDDMVDGPTARLSQPYAQSAWIRFAVDSIAGEISNRPLKFYQADQEYTDPAFESWWDRPALGPDIAGVQSRLSRSDVQRDLASWAKLEGEFFLLFDDSWAAAGLRRNPGALSPFLIANPTRVRLIISAGVIQGYEYVDQAGRRSVWLPEQVIHWKAFNPYDEYRGLGDLPAATVAAESAFYTGVYIRELMRNNGDTGFIVVGKSGVADPKQQEQIVSDLRAKRAALRAGIAKDLFLTGDITVERPQEQAAGEGVVASQGLTRQEILVAFKVPPSMGESKQSYSMGKDSDRYQLITSVCQPLGAQIAGAFSKVGSRMTGQALTAEMEWDDHPVMVEVRNARLDQALKLWSTGWAWIDINDYLDLGMEPFPGWETPYLSFSVVPANTAGSSVTREPTQDPALAETESRRTRSDDPAIAQLKALLALRSRAVATAKTAEQVETDALAAFACGCLPGDGPDKCRAASTAATASGYVPQKAQRDPAEIALWRQHMSQRRETVAAYKSAFGRVLMAARIETLRKVETLDDKEAREGKAAVSKSAVDDFIFDKSKFSESFFTAMRNQGKAALDRAGAQLLREIGRDDPFHFAPHDVLAFLGDRENKLAGVPDNVFERIRASLTAGIDAGDSTAALAKRVKAEFNSIGDGEALRVAQTETSAAFGFGRQEAMKKAGVQFKAWLTSGNANVREAHQIAGLSYPRDGGIPVDQPFIVDGEELMHPGDSAGSPGNVINCHCISIAVTAPDNS